MFRRVNVCFDFEAVHSSMFHINSCHLIFSICNKDPQSCASSLFDEDQTYPSVPLMAFWLFYWFSLPGKKEVIHCSSLRILEVRQQCSSLFLLPTSFPSFFCLYVRGYFLLFFSLCVCVPMVFLNCFLLWLPDPGFCVCEVCATVFIWILPFSVAPESTSLPWINWGNVAWCCLAMLEADTAWVMCVL